MYRGVFFFLFASYLLSIINAKTADGEGGYPGFQYEFKVEVGAGKKECFYQYVKEQAQMHLSFEVLRGADRNVDVTLKKDNRVIESHMWTFEGSSDIDITERGVYSLCIDNSFARFSSKVVYIYFVAYVTDEWQKYTEELKSFQISVNNFTRSARSVQEALQKTKAELFEKRKIDMYHMYLMIDTSWSINFWSTIFLIVLICTSALQVFFVRRLFKINKLPSVPRP
ncbi:DgyrCDS1899 [Dimorphilus gyrociliatus]|uniref:DgyrCDS1899 n=1 Tax=Dimorphilus gyrociliatus TaxID=2664684 RepID=A0A7I8VBG9_9ANNE|nr:DgyrCDS1899 [Dimorphilus gyrociliatus]